MKITRTLLALIMILGLVSFLGCDDDDDNGGTNPDPNPTTEPWVGNWLSEGSNIAPILVAVFNYDRVEVEMKENGTVDLTTRVTGQAPTTISGTYSVTESATGDIHSIALVYSSFEQEGIIQVVEGTPDIMRLEVVQTVPDIGATPLTPSDGFGADATLGDSNIQVYERVMP